ncbi:hypothetical protein D7024_01220 [Desulfofundulus salinus]|uniref:Uncharacterized protein n=1 Tax=Desulfofundulus salinus TaxID=2419843 RepID=A0A494X4Y7_9FIRM|nr:hypothetical protein D7024_01220 [Desulfofundulus salinum]
MYPELREKAVSTCSECRFFVRIQGREEARWGCVAGLPEYRTLRKRVPAVLHAVDILKAAGKEGLYKALECDNPERQACGLFLCRK